MMKKIPYNIKLQWSLMLVFAALATLLSCQDEEGAGRPSITEVRNYAASPNDTLITTLVAGQWVVMLGNDLGDVSEIYFAGQRATINAALFTKGSIVVQVPSIPFQSVPADKRNEIMLVSQNGSTTYQVDIVGPPLITHIRNYADAPNDTVIQKLLPGQQINVLGYNLKHAKKISFLGVDADISTVIYTDSSAIIQVPADLSKGIPAQVNKLSYTTGYGDFTFSIKIVGPPLITGISNEVPAPGDSVFIYGDNLDGTQNVTFAGASISDYRVSSKGTSVRFVCPTLSQSGPVVVTTEGGVATTSYQVNDVTTGGISCFEWSGPFAWAWWGGANIASGDPSSSSPPYNPDFPANPSQYLVLNTSPMNAGDGYPWSTAIRMEDVQWLPVANLTDPIGQWVLKFEMNVPANWNGITISITTSNGAAYRFEPWRTPTGTKPYKTQGWQTVTIPLSAFRTSDGTGALITTLKDLVGTAGKSHMLLVMKNYGTAVSATGFSGAFDNFRVIKP